ncbi:MAG: hypothetical protein M1838_005142 [Thelocarpon superellum]|nr:MAG: hypothetical protein M1838_005142 [Thelocarpon superellum]
MTMATGGIANVIYTIPFRFHGLSTIGIIFSLFNIVLFIFNVVMISIRFSSFQHTFQASFLHPTESLFAPALLISLGTILLNIEEYAMERWSTQTFTVADMTPVWIFPTYPLLLAGPQAAVLAAGIDPDRALDIVIGGYTLQGIGFLVSFMIYGAFIYRLMTQKLPTAALRPGMFVSVGPAAFTVSTIVGITEQLHTVLPSDFLGDGQMAASVLGFVGAFVALWLWGLSIWFFLISVFAHVNFVGHARLQFSMTWYSFVFPNSALVTATLGIGRTFKSHAIQVVGTVFAVILIGVWMLVFGMMVRAVYLKQILWPQKGEDRDEGGFEWVAHIHRKLRHS